MSRRQEIDIPPIDPIITEYQQEKIECYCGHCNKGKFPEHITSPFQLGQNLQSFIIYLNTAHYIPYERLTQILDDMLNILYPITVYPKIGYCFTLYANRRDGLSATALI